MRASSPHSLWRHTAGWLRLFKNTPHDRRRRIEPVDESFKGLMRAQFFLHADRLDLHAGAMRAGAGGSDQQEANQQALRGVAGDSARARKFTMRRIGPEDISISIAGVTDAEPAAAGLNQPVGLAAGHGRKILNAEPAFAAIALAVVA